MILCIFFLTGYDWFVLITLSVVRGLRTRDHGERGRTGISSPSNRPQGFISSMRSKIILRMPANGIHRNMPDTPQAALPSNTKTMEISALIFTLEETI